MKISDLFPIRGVRPGEPAGKGGPVAEAGTDLKLTTGQVLKGRVAGVTAQGKILLEIAGQTVTARSTVALRPGTEFWFEVKEAGTEPWLALAGKKGAAREFLQQALGETQALNRAVSALFGLKDAAGQVDPRLAGRIKELLGAFSSVSLDAGAEPERLARLLSWFTGQREGNGASLFGRRLDEQLADLGRALQKSGPGALDKAGLSGLDKLGGFLEAMRQVNSQVPAQHQPLFLLFPCFFANEAGWGSWLLNFAADQGEDREEAGYALSFFLEMSRLGELQLQVAVNGKELQGVFAMADEDALAHMAEQLPELRARLAALGYQPLALTCRLAEESLLQGLKTAVEEAVRLQPVRVVDIQA